MFLHKESVKAGNDIIDILTSEDMENTAFSRLNARGLYLKLGLVDRRLFEPGVYSGPGVYLLSVFFSYPFFIISTEGLLN